MRSRIYMCPISRCVDIEISHVDSNVARHQSHQNDGEYFCRMRWFVSISSEPVAIQDNERVVKFEWITYRGALPPFGEANTISALSARA